MIDADKMKAEALAVFGGLEYPELARDVIEWFHASMLVQQEQAPLGAPIAPEHAAELAQLSVDAEALHREYLRGVAAGSQKAHEGIKAGIEMMGVELARLRLEVQQEQAGWQRVPVEPTPEMVNAFHDSMNKWIHEIGEDGDVYKAMLAAAPKGEKP